MGSRKDRKLRQLVTPRSPRRLGPRLRRSPTRPSRTHAGAVHPSSRPCPHYAAGSRGLAEPCTAPKLGTSHAAWITLSGPPDREKMLGLVTAGRGVVVPLPVMRGNRLDLLGEQQRRV